MESYPEDLLVGVFPLVFAVNAVFDPTKKVDNTAGSSTDSNPNTTSTAHNNTADGVSPKNRSDFDRFLDAMAGSLVDENDDADVNEQLEFPPIIATEGPTSSSRNVSLFRPDDDELDESTDDDLILDYDDDDYTGGIGTNSTSRRRSSSGTNSIRLYAGFGLSRRSMGALGAGSHSHSSNSTSYAKALQHGQGFFQRARIVSISTKHGFPPSKDPEGNNNIVFALKQARTSPQKAREVFTERPIQGIIPAGWLEKHVYALPSVVLVVVKLSKSNQGAQDSLLIKTVESLHYSLVAKRLCKIHVVSLVDDDINVAQAQQWSLDVSREIVDSNPAQQDSHQITLLRAGKDLRSGTDGFPTSVALKRLHRSVRDSSLLYYLGQARRTKDKLAKLSEGGKKRLTNAKQRAQPPKELLPLAIRYCFKIAIYYEFQLKFEKSLKFMAEAYRYVRSYYHHLVRLSTRDSDLSDDEDDRRYADDRKAITGNVSISTGDTEDMEVSITDATSQTSSADSARWSAAIPPPPADMAHQCLAVADWLNFKLLQAGFGSHTEGGLLAADVQWRQHSRVFCARRFLGGHPIMSEEWYFWCHVAHQRLVMSQLVERHPPRALGDLGNQYDEVLLRCAPWRAYEAAAEAYLKAGASVQEALVRKGHTGSVQEKDDARAPFVGGLDKDGLASLLDKEAKVDHKGKALELVLRAISMFEQAALREGKVGKEKDTEDLCHRPWGRFGARLYYLAGGILVSKRQYKEATDHLEHAAKYSTGWSGLEIATNRLLAECYKNEPSACLVEAESNNSSMVVKTFFEAKMPTAKLLRSIESYISVTKADSIQWKCECFDEFDNLPFAFAVNFPKRSHATAGDTVVASVFLKSKLDYTVLLESICLLSMAGEIHVPPSDFMAASEKGRIVTPKNEFVLSTKITLPKNIDEIYADESSDKQSKNSYTKSARPRTAGITAAAGARLVSEETFRTSPCKGSANWSLNFLGGKPLRCEGIRLLMHVWNKDSSATQKDFKPIELTIEKKKPKTPANIKRTPFEEDNYIASSWYRPLHMSLPDGPRCLRVLGPMSEMEITNLTEAVCDGRAVEGTVNRICLKLQAGTEEMCSDIRYKISCSSTLVTEDGMTKRLAAADSEEENTLSMKKPELRTPLLVSNAKELKSPVATDYGFEVPTGWELVGSGQETTDEVGSNPSALASGESTFIFVDLYRPSAMTSGSIFGAKVEIASICQTEFEVTVSYSQERRKGRSGEQKVGSDIVSQKFSGSVVWAAPIIASFDRGLRNSTPSGSRHPSNLTDEARPSDTSAFRNIPIVDGERVSIKGSLKFNNDFESCGFSGFEICKVTFEEGNEPESPCKLTVATESKKGDSGLLYRAHGDDPSRFLKDLSRFSFVFSIQAEMRNKNRSSTFPLGIISVEWKPEKIDLPEEVKALPGLEIMSHGPLALLSPITVRFRGPVCYIEKAPFKTAFECSPPVPKVSEPFTVIYSIKNETFTNQSLSVRLDGRQNSNLPQEILVCGLVSGDLKLGPFETQKLSYIAVATKPGMTTLPGVTISSNRYHSWVVNEGTDNARPLCVLP